MSEEKNSEFVAIGKTLIYLSTTLKVRVLLFDYSAVGYFVKWKQTPVKKEMWKIDAKESCTFSNQLRYSDILD